MQVLRQSYVQKTPIPWNRVLEKLGVAQTVKTFHVFYVNKRFTIVSQGPATKHDSSKRCLLCTFCRKKCVCIPHPKSRVCFMVGGVSPLVPYFSDFETLRVFHTCVMCKTSNRFTVSYDWTPQMAERLTYRHDFTISRCLCQVKFCVVHDSGVLIPAWRCVIVTLRTSCLATVMPFRDFLSSSRQMSG